MAGRAAQHRPVPVPPPRCPRHVRRLDNQVRGCVARLRALAGTDPDAPDLAALVGELLLGQRLGIYLAEPGTPDYDAMILLGMTAPRHTEQPAAQH